MKRLTLIAFLIVAGTVGAFAQSKSLVGKWKLSSYSSEGVAVTFDNPTETKKQLAEQLKKENGKEPDSAQVDMVYNVLLPIASMSFEFSDKGVAYFSVPTPNGVVNDTAAYVADYKAGIFTTTSKNEDGIETKDSSKFRFEGDLLVIEIPEKGELIKLKRSK